MKKLITLIIALLLITPLMAKSTCQTRVDKNLDKSTSDKVQKCLTEEQKEQDETPQPEVILTETYSVMYPQPKDGQNQKQDKKQNKNKNQNQKQNQAQKQNNSKKTQGQKTYTPQEVQNEYLGRTTYPSFRNDTLPALNPEEAHDTALNALKGYKKPTVSKPAKSTKPGKQNATKPAVEQAEDQTSPVEIQQADTLQDDLMALPTDPNAPASFEDDGVMGPADFGFNDTDPAFKQ